jgi:hypothetical protein
MTKQKPTKKVPSVHAHPQTVEFGKTILLTPEFLVIIQDYFTEQPQFYHPTLHRTPIDLFWLMVSHAIENEKFDSDGGSERTEILYVYQDLMYAWKGIEGLVVKYGAEYFTKVKNGDLLPINININNPLLPVLQYNVSESNIHKNIIERKQTIVKIMQYALTSNRYENAPIYEIKDAFDAANVMNSILDGLNNMVETCGGENVIEAIANNY